jgi:hypothetical protein
MKQVLIFIFLCIGLSTYGQTFTYSYKDPCNGNLKTVIVPSGQDQVAVTYYNQINSFKLDDFSNPIEREKLSPQIEELLEQNFIELKKEDNSISLCLSTRQIEISRLSKYNNMPEVQEKLLLNHFLEQIVAEKEVHKPIISVIETTTLSETRNPETLKERKKVFFG